MKPGKKFVPKGYIKRLENLVNMGHYQSIDKALRIGLLMVVDEMMPEKRNELAKLDNESIVKELVKNYDLGKSHIYISAAREAVKRKEKLIAREKRERNKPLYYKILDSRLTR